MKETKQSTACTPYRLVILSCQIGYAHLGTTNEEDEAGHRAHAIQARHIRQVIKVVANVVLQKARACQLPLRLRARSE